MKDILNDINGVEDDVRTVLENREFSSRICSEEGRTQVFSRDRVHMV